VVIVHYYNDHGRGSPKLRENHFITIDYIRHASIKTTGDVYAQVTGEIEKKTARLFGDFIRKNG